MHAINTRQAKKADCTDILWLMKQLAEFEGYANDFAVTESYLQKHCFELGTFTLFVAEVDAKIAGMLVCFEQPFTYDLSPWLIIKELYVHGDYRGLGLGQNLMQKAAAHCLSRGGLKMKWDVLTSNTKAKAFYVSMGASLCDDWQTMTMDKSALLALSKN